MTRIKRAVLPLVAAVVTLSACSAGSGATPGTTTVTTTVTSSGGGSGTASPPHIVASTTESPTTAGGPPRCDGPTLGVTVAGSEGAAGTIYYTLLFTNNASTTCYLQGFPGVAAADASGTAKVNATRSPTPRATKVVLSAGKAAHASLAVRNVPPTSSPCPAYPRLLVTPPDSRRTSSISVTVRPCADQMQVTVVQPGSA